MAKVKMVLRFPTVDKVAGDQIEVDADQVDALVASGSASPAKAETKAEKG